MKLGKFLKQFTLFLNTFHYHLYSQVGGGMYERGNRRVNNLVDGFSKVHTWHFAPGTSLSDEERLQ